MEFCFWFAGLQELHVKGWYGPAVDAAALAKLHSALSVLVLFDCYFWTDIPQVSPEFAQKLQNRCSQSLKGL